MLCKVFEDGECGHGEDLLFLHQPHGLVAELIGVVDGNDAGLRRKKGSGLSSGVDRDVSVRVARPLSPPPPVAASVY